MEDDYDSIVDEESDLEDYESGSDGVPNDNELIPDELKNNDSDDNSDEDNDHDDADSYASDISIISEYDSSEFDEEKNKVFQLTDDNEIDSNTIILKPENRITSEHMTTYEYSKVIGDRATHIANGSDIFTNIEHLTDPRDIAKKEINELLCPLSILRKHRNNTAEIWSVNEMIKPNI